MKIGIDIDKSFNDLLMAENQMLLALKMQDKNKYIKNAITLLNKALYGDAEIYDCENKDISPKED